MDIRETPGDKGKTNKPELIDYLKIIILLVLVIAGLVFIYWSNGNYKSNFLDSLEQEIVP